ncbi:MAG: 7-cyano-7-deazaguanine synthase, partial [Candidatus Dadabacteria bacterium]
THTADPRYLLLMEELFQFILGNPNLEIINPFQYKTKSEVFGLLPKKLQQASIDTISCWKYSRLKMHCGICIPCIARRIAIESNGLSFNEYHEDLFNSDINKLGDDNTGKRNLIDYLEFVHKLHHLVPATIQDFIYNDAPELLNDCIDQTLAMDMYRRLAQESIDVFKQYPNICKLMV